MNVFKSTQFSKPARNVFNLSHDRKMSFNMGDLVPIMCTEVLPGDKFKISSESLIRMAPMLAPVMHRVNVFTHFFFVPNRLVWDEWEDFITGGEDGTKLPVLPYLSINAALYGKTGSLADYMGCPSIDVNPTIPAQVNAIPFRAYQSIYNEYYRDQDLEDEIPVNTTSGEDSSRENMFKLRKRAWEKDYFTSARPSAQKGYPA